MNERNMVNVSPQNIFRGCPYENLASGLWATQFSVGKDRKPSILRLYENMVRSNNKLLLPFETKDVAFPSGNYQWIYEHLHMLSYAGTIESYTDEGFLWITGLEKARASDFLVLQFSN